MKYLDRKDAIEIGIIALIVVMVLLAVTVIIVAVYYMAHSNLPGCVPNVTL